VPVFAGLFSRSGDDQFCRAEVRPKTGELTDETTKKFIASYVDNLVKFTLLHQKK
jgi:hypothetical protein